MNSRRSWALVLSTVAALVGADEQTASALPDLVREQRLAAGFIDTLHDGDAALRAALTARVNDL